MGKKIVNIALQGGGTHVAFSWGVLDYLLEDGRIGFEGGSGTSAGGLVCAALGQGLMKNGNQGARDELRAFWEFVSKYGTQVGLRPSLLDKLLGREGVDYSFAYRLIRYYMMMQMSPSRWNATGLIQLKMLLSEFFDIEKLSSNKDFKLFLTATNVKTSKVKIFTGKELTFDAMMASACLPLIFPPVEIDGATYWDGGYIGNPSLFPIIYNCDSSDIIVILVVPQSISHTPESSKEVEWRMLELFHVNTLTREMRAIDFVTSLIEKGIADPTKLKKINIHIISDHAYFAKFNPSSTMNTNWEFMMMLYEHGRNVAKKWLKDNYQHIGVKSSANIREMFV